MSRSMRMFEIIQLLRNASSPMTAQKIGELLEVSKRTAYRDIAALKAMRVPIDGEAGIGYIMRPGFDLPPLAFAPDEIEAIIVGLALLQRTGDTGLQLAAARVAMKINDVLPDDVTPQNEDPTLHVSSWMTAQPTGQKTGILRRAIREEECVRLTYQDLSEELTERVVKPLAVLYYIEVVLLAAWCELRCDFRHFRIDRINKLEVTGTHFTGEGLHLRKTWQEHNRLA